MSDFFARLESRARAIDSLLCVGLDPRVNPAELGDGSVLLEQNSRIIEATAEHTLCYKPNSAFYEQHGTRGLELLARTVQMIPDEIPVLLDAKRGDIGSTAEAYATAAQALGVDAITVSPYMGGDSVGPFLKAGLAVFVLSRTSNPGGNEFQLLASEGLPLYRQVARAALGWGDAVGLVVAANNTQALEEIRQAHPDAWFLAPGIGTQGGGMAQACASGLRSDGRGLLPVVARGIANASDPGQAAGELVAAYRAARDRRIAGNALDPAVVRALLDAVLDTGCFRTGTFTLKSGIQSPFYIDLRRLQSNAAALRAAAAAYAALLEQANLGPVARLAAVPVAAITLATAVTLATDIPLIYPRLPPKAHGSGNRIEGDWAPGERVVMVDDLITTGKSKLEAAAVLREEGLIVDQLLVLIERGVQGRRDMEQAGITLHAAARIEELVERARSRSVVTEADARRVSLFLEEQR